MKNPLLVHLSSCSLIFIPVYYPYRDCISRLIAEKKETGAKRRNGTITDHLSAEIKTTTDDGESLSQIKFSPQIFDKRATVAVNTRGPQSTNTAARDNQAPFSSPASPPRASFPLVVPRSFETRTCIPNAHALCRRLGRRRCRCHTELATRSGAACTAAGSSHRDHDSRVTVALLGTPGSERSAGCSTCCHTRCCCRGRAAEKQQNIRKMKHEALQKLYFFVLQLLCFCEYVGYV